MQVYNSTGARHVMTLVYSLIYCICAGNGQDILSPDPSSEPLIFIFLSNSQLPMKIQHAGVCSLSSKHSHSSIVELSRPVLLKECEQLIAMNVNSK